MTRATLLALAERVEAATGADRELDAQVWLACVPGTTRNELCYIHKASSRECVIDETRDANRRLIIVPYYTASLDAAMSLVPSGYEWSVNWCGNSVANVSEIGVDYPVHCGGAATPALALTAACLRARAIAGSLPD